MRKLKLELESLSVESFDLEPESPARNGTVHARGEQQTDYYEGGEAGGGYTQGTCIGPTFCCAPSWMPTCQQTCNTCPYTCAATCPQTCPPGCTYDCFL